MAVDSGEASSPWSSPLLNWAGGLNSCCLLELIGNIPSAETKANLYAALVTPLMAAQLTKNLPPANPARFIVGLQGCSFILHLT